MFISPSTKEMILKELKTTDIQKVSRHFGIPVRIIRDFLGAKPAPASVHVERYGGYGRPELQKYIVARTKAGDGWPDVEKARQNYDAGLIELCQGRDGDWLILYAIPRKHPDRNRVRYFS